MTHDPANQNFTIAEDEIYWRQRGQDAARSGLTIHDCPLLQNEAILERRSGDTHRWSISLLAWNNGYRQEVSRLAWLGPVGGKKPDPED